MSDSLRPHELQHTRLPCPHQLLESTQTHVHRVSDASNHLILCRPILLLPSVFPSIRVSSSESALHIRWPNGDKKLEWWFPGAMRRRWRRQWHPLQYSCLENPMDGSTPGLPVHHQLLELAQTRVHQVGDAIQPSHPLSSPSPPAFNLSQHQGLFQ